jgi:hypothetical protein
VEYACGELLCAAERYLTIGKIKTLPGFSNCFKLLRYNFFLFSHNLQFALLKPDNNKFRCKIFFKKFEKKYKNKGFFLWEFLPAPNEVEGSFVVGPGLWAKTHVCKTAIIPTKSNPLFFERNHILSNFRIQLSKHAFLAYNRK